MEPSSTVHRLLQYKTAGSQKDEEESLEGSYAFCRGNPLPADAVLVDEASMLDITLAAALLEALGPNTQLVLVGKILSSLEHQVIHPLRYGDDLLAYVAPDRRMEEVQDRTPWYKAA